jgi:hypothetical protein
MATLHIEHAITDLSTWLQAFDSFGDARTNAGVLAQRVHHPVGNETYIVVQLDFTDTDAALAFQQFLETVVWQSSDLSPGLDGTPTARVLEDVHTAS